jgi:PKD repeat protein
VALAGLLLSCLAVGQADAQAGSPALTADPTSGPAPLNIMFTVSLPSASTIDFGDGSTGGVHPAPVCYGCPPLATASHVYQRPGSYIARIIANGRPVGGATVMVRAN